MALLVFPQPPDADDYDGERRWRRDCKRETIEARHRRLGKLGPALGDLAALRHLDVGDNEIEAFEGGDHAAMETLAIYSNRLTSLVSLPRFGNLRFLGVGYNRIEALPRTLCERCPLLECFDGAYNALASLDVSVDALGGCAHLRQCVLTGNPCALLPNYRKRVAFGLPQLARLDDVDVAPVDAADGDDATITIHVALRALLGLSGAPPTAADEASPEEEGVFVELLVVGAPPATARRTRRLPWRAAPVAPPAPDAESAIPVEVALEVPAVAAVRDGLKLSGLLVSVLKATPAAPPEDGAEREPEALAVLAAATVPLAALLEPSFAEGSSLVETAALAFENGEAADDASVTVAVRLNPGDE